MTALLFLLLVLLAVPSRSQIGGPIYNPETGHWYEAITVPGGITWANARIAAAARSHQGLPGYLATPTHSEENFFIVDNFPQAISGGYALGGMQPPGTTDPKPGWFWISGEEWWFDYWDASKPEPLGEAGVLVYLGDSFRNVRQSTVVGGYVVEYGTAPPLVPTLKFRRSTLPLPAPRELTCADFDGDGHTDLSAGAPTDLVIFFGNGDGTFAPPISLGLTAPTNELVAEDFDGDGDRDVATITDNGLYVFRKLPGRNYAPPDFYGGVGSFGLHARDLNGDNRPELITSHHYNSRIRIFLNQGNGTFVAGDQEFARDLPDRIQTADWTGDGHLDVAIDCKSPGEIHVYSGDGSGGITPLVSLSTQSAYPTGMRAVDFNQDGLQDLVVGITHRQDGWGTVE